MDHDPYFGATGERRNPGHKCWQNFLREEVDIFAGPGAMAADQACCSVGDINGLKQQSADGGGEVLLLGDVDNPLERLQGTPLGAVLPPHRESHAGH